MAAYNDSYPWTSYYGHYDFFEQRIGGHSRTAQLQRCGDGLYILTKKDGAQLRVFVCECYSYGVAEYMETVGKIGKVDAVIINSNWCGYTPDAKQHCREQKVGLFTIAEFMGALNQRDFWKYLTPVESEVLKARVLRR